MERGNFLYLNKIGKLMLLFVFILMIGVGYAAEDWGSINSESDLDKQNVSDTENEIDSSQLINNEVAVSGDDSESSSSVGEYNRDFYIAIGLGALGILIIALFVYLFIRGPKNKWKDTK